MAKRNGTSFLIQNKQGVFYYQRRIADSYRTAVPSLPVFTRLSLRTKDKPLARRIARTIATMWDVSAKKLFKSEDDYIKGMDLLRQFLSKSQLYKTFEEISEHFFDLLDDETDSETKLLGNALDLFRTRQIQSGINPFEMSVDRITAYIDSKVAEVAQPKIVEEPDRPLLSVAFELFLASQRGAWKAIGGSEKVYRQTFLPFLVGVVGDIPTNRVTKSHINDLVTVLLVYPANKNKLKEYAHLTYRDFLNIDTPNEVRLKPVTQRKYLTNIGTVLRWMKSTDLTTIDLDAPIKAVKIQKPRAVTQRSNFTKEDIRKLFNSEDYVKGLHKTASRFWVPLIALYTGARINEICQLSTNDITLDAESNRWIFDINENEDVPNKSLKRWFHARFVPIHQRLIDLGFLEYVEETRKKHIRVFPELIYKRDENKYANDIQRWFNRTYKSNCNVTTPKTSFHSFRHTTITYLVTAHHVSEDTTSFGFGQTPKGGVFIGTYSKLNNLHNYAKYFDLIDFDDCFDVTAIRNWTHQSFANPHD